MRDYLLQNDKLPNTMYFSILYFGNGLEASCRMGAVNIFYYLRSHPRYSFIPIKIQHLYDAIVGKNDDLIGYCIERVPTINVTSVQLSIETHNHQFFEYAVKLFETNPKKVSSTTGIFPIKLYLTTIRDSFNLVALDILYQYGQLQKIFKLIQIS